MFDTLNNFKGSLYNPIDCNPLLINSCIPAALFADRDNPPVKFIPAVNSPTPSIYLLGTSIVLIGIFYVFSCLKIYP